MDKTHEIEIDQMQIALALVRIMWRKGEINDSWYANVLRKYGVTEESEVCESR